MHGTDTLLGGAYVLAGFYIAHSSGLSQVYNVFAPFFVASIVAGYPAWGIRLPQSRGNTLPYYFNLPRDRMATWDAHLAFLVGVVLWLEGAILLGTHFKLGGAGITPHYRLHPELFFLPFLTIAAVFSYAHIRHSVSYVCACLIAIILFCWGIYRWTGNVFGDHAGEHNNFLPPREFALSQQFAFAALLLGVAVGVLIFCRRYWQRREVGEIK